MLFVCDSALCHYHVSHFKKDLHDNVDLCRSLSHTHAHTPLFLTFFRQIFYRVCLKTDINEEPYKPNMKIFGYISYIFTISHGQNKIYQLILKLKIKMKYNSWSVTSAITAWYKKSLWCSELS